MSPSSLKNLQYLILTLLIVVCPCASGLPKVSSGVFVLSGGGNSSIDFDLTIQSDPGDDAYVSWSQRFVFEHVAGGQGGRIGLLRAGVQKRFVFSISAGVAAVALMPGADVGKIDGRTSRLQISGIFDWQLNHTYRFRLQRVGAAGAWWQAMVTDLSSGDYWVLGKIQTRPGLRTLSRYVSTLTDVFMNGGDCAAIPYARAVFGPPTADRMAKRTIKTSAYTVDEFAGDCVLSTWCGAESGGNIGSRSDVIRGDLVHQIGLSRGPQRWTDFDRRGRLGSIFWYPNPFSHRVEYFRLLQLGMDGHNRRFPTDGRSDAYWQYLGNIEPEYSAFAEISAE